MMIGLTTMMFTADTDEAPVLFVQKDTYYEELNIMLTKKNSDEIDENKLNAEDYQKFQFAKKKEWTAVSDSGALRVCSIEESLQIMKDMPERCLPSRNVCRWKETPGQHESWLAKVRWCILGFMDPDMWDCIRSAPTPMTSTLHIFMQICSNRDFETWLRDFKNAFSQSIKTTRKAPIYAKLAKNHGTGLDDRQIVELLKESYGLVCGPRAWRVTLVKALLSLGYQKSSYERASSSCSTTTTTRCS